MKNLLVCVHEAGRILVALNRGFCVEGASVSEYEGSTQLRAPAIQSFADEISAKVSRLRCSSGEEAQQELSRLLQEHPVCSRLVDVYLGGMSATLGYLDHLDKFDPEKLRQKPILESIAGLFGFDFVVRGINDMISWHRLMKDLPHISLMAMSASGSTEFFRSPEGHPGAEADARAIENLFFSTGEAPWGFRGGLSLELRRRVLQIENYLTQDYSGNVGRLTNLAAGLLHRGSLTSKQIGKLSA